MRQINEPAWWTTIAAWLSTAFVACVAIAVADNAAWSLVMIIPLIIHMLRDAVDSDKRSKEEE